MYSSVSFKKKLYSSVQMRTSTANASQRIKTTASWEAEKRESTFDKSDGWILSLTGRRGWILYPKMSKSNLNRFEKEETPLLRIIRDEAQEVLRRHNGGITSDGRRDRSLVLHPWALAGLSTDTDRWYGRTHSPLLRWWTRASFGCAM